MQHAQPEERVCKAMRFLGVWLVGAMPCVFAYGQGSPANTQAIPQLAAIVERMQAVQSDPGIAPPYQVIREYTLFSENSSNPSSDVWAEVDYLPPNHKTYVIQKRVGSSRGEDVVRRILQRESEMGTEPRSQSAVDNSNYSFAYLGEATLEGMPCYLLSLNPKRKEAQLIRGRAWVDQHSFRIRRIEGEMARSPSWLLKRVNLKIGFADVGGAWLQTDMEAVAEVRFLGSQTLKSDTVDARVGNLVTQRTAPDFHDRSAKSNRVPAAVVVPHHL
jgi:hypothetical protein